MPQFDPTFFVPQLIWLAISFVVLYLLMARTALPRIGTVLEERRERIDDNLDRAEALKTEAAEAEQAYTKALATARSEAQEAILKVRTDASAEASRRQGALGETLGARIKEAEARIEASKSAVMADIKKLAADAATTAAEKLTGERMDTGTVEAAVARALEGRNR